MQYEPRQQVGRYVIQGELGRGAMGVVYRALDPTLGRTIAIKTIHVGHFHSEHEIAYVQARLMREAHAAGVLSHPSIVTIYDILQEPATAFIFMEFVDGVSLDKLLSDEDIEKTHLLNILRQSAEALDYAHERGVVHRDIKPANIMIARDGRAKIADFGVARTQSQSLTRTGQILGTPEYMSPEQISGKAVDGRSDQFSLAVIAYEVLAGKKPFAAASLPALMYRIVTDAPVPIQQWNFSLTAGVDNVLRRALAKAPDERYPTCSDFLRALERECQKASGWTIGPAQAVHSRSRHSADSPSASAVAGLPAVAEVRQVRSPTQTASPINLKLIAAGGIVTALLSGSAVIWKLRQDRQAMIQPQSIDNKANAKRQPSQPDEGRSQTGPIEAPRDPDRHVDSQNTKEPAPVLKAVGAAPDRPQDAASAISIISNPSGANVIIDGGKSAPCSTPCLLELPHGRHTIAVSLNTYKPEHRVLELPRDSAISISLEKHKGVIEVTSTPTGAAVFIDGVEQEVRTPIRMLLPVGKYTVTVSLPGRIPYTQSIDMRPDVTLSIHPQWEK